MGFLTSMIQYRTLIKSLLGITIPGEYPYTAWSRLPGYVIVGDSTGQQGNTFATSGTLTAVGTRATIVHNLTNLVDLGQRIVITGANESQYNGVFIIDEVVNSTTSKFNLLTAPSAATATGTIWLTLWQRVNDKNWAALSNFMSGHKGLYLGNFALSGAQTSALTNQISIAFNPDNNPWGRTPDIVFVSAGINDTRGAQTLATTQTNLTNAIVNIRERGATPIVLTTWPYNNATTGWSADNAARTNQLNEWIRGTVPSLGGIVIDAQSICSDPANAYGDWKTNYGVDNLHPSKVGALQVAKEIKRLVWDNIDSSDDRVLTSIADNADLSGTTGTLTGIGASGSVADVFTVTAGGGGSQTVVAAKGVALSGNGESQRMTITAAALNDFGLLKTTNSFHADVVAGDKIFARVRLRTESAMLEVNYIGLSASTTVGGVTNTRYAEAPNTDNTINRWAEKIDMIFETPPFIVQASTTSITFSLTVLFGAAGSAIVDISDFDVYKF